MHVRGTGSSPASPSPRELAVRVLRDIARTRGFSNRSLSNHLERNAGMDPRDRALCTTLVYGVLRHRLRLDAHIDHHAHRPAGIKGGLRDILRIAVFEMRELQRPSAIAATEAFKTLSSIDPRGALRGVAQAILSGVDRQGEALDHTFERGSPLDVLEHRWSIPRWLAGRWLKQLGPEAALRRAQCIAAPPSIDLRLDPTRQRVEDTLARLREELVGAEIERVPGYDTSVRVRGGGDLFYGALHDEGLISVQGLAAQQPARMLDPQPDERILDACCGMGVKTLQLAELMQRRGVIVAADRDPQQLAQLEALEQRGRLDTAALDLQVVRADVGQDDPALDDAPFDRILLDVPCTGLGNLARHPEIRWHRQYEDIAAHVPLQRALLERNLGRLKPGGTLVYAVCSAEPEEGRELMAVCQGNPDYVLLKQRTWTPEDDGCEGFYAAVWTRLLGP